MTTNVRGNRRYVYETRPREESNKGKGAKVEVPKDRNRLGVCQRKRSTEKA